MSGGGLVVLKTGTTPFCTKVRIFCTAIVSSFWLVLMAMLELAASIRSDMALTCGMTTDLITCGKKKSCQITIQKPSYKFDDFFKVCWTVLLQARKPSWTLDNFLDDFLIQRGLGLK